LDITVAEGERVFFKVTGTHTVYLTGNYVIPAEEGPSEYDEDEDDEDDEDDYDLSPDEDDLVDMGDLLDDDEEDELDGLAHPRVTEIESDEEEAPKLVDSKGKNKRTADSDEEMALDDMMAKDGKAKGADKGEPALSKKQQKKLKKNNGEAVAVEEKKEAKEAKEGKEAKKVQFAKNLEQGPTPSGQKPGETTTGTLGVKEVKGVKIDDKKLGKGLAAKAGNTVAMRYIGKLEDGKVFDGVLPLCK
jgi:FK506-binding nuclear protein